MANHRRQNNHKRGIGCLFSVTTAVMVMAIFVIVGAILFSTISPDINALRDVMGSYTPLGATGKIATICVTPSDTQYKLTVYLKQYDQSSKPKALQVFSVNGDLVRLEGTIIHIRIQSLINFINLQSGYKLTSLAGYYSNPIEAQTSHPNSIVLNGGEDAEFIKLQKNASPVATASLDNPLVVPYKTTSNNEKTYDGTTYDLYATESGLIALPDSHIPPGCGVSSKQ